MNEIYLAIAALGKKYGAEKIVLFGSRARKDNNDRSDIDLAVYNMPQENRSLFWYEIDDLPTLLKFDLIYITEDINAILLQNIEKDGIVLYERLQNKS